MWTWRVDYIVCSSSCYFCLIEKQCLLVDRMMHYKWCCCVYCTIKNFTFVSLKLTRCEWNWFDTTRLNPVVSELNVFSLVIGQNSTIMWFHWSKLTNSNKALTYPPAPLLSCLKFSRCRNWYEVLEFNRIHTLLKSRVGGPICSEYFGT